MSNLIYHEVIPNNLQVQYTQNENVDFDISVPNRKINLGSIMSSACANPTMKDNKINLYRVFICFFFNFNTLYFELYT